MLHPTQIIAVRAILVIPTQFITVHTIMYVLSMDITMATEGNTVVAPLCAPSSAPSQSLFDAIDDLSQMYLTDQWTGSIKFRCLPVNRLMIGLPLDKLSIVQEIDICDYLGYSNSDRTVSRLYLDPHTYDQPATPPG